MFSPKLPVHGQGVFLFTAHKKEAKEAKEASFSIVGGNNKIHVKITKDAVNATSFPGGEPLIDEENHSGLTPGASYWFSVDSQNQNICVGIGEPRLETLIYKYLFTQNTKAFLESLRYIVIHKNSVKLLKFLRDPITSNVPLLVMDTAGLTMDHVANSRVMPVANLPAISQKLYNCISGPNFTLSTEFPEFYEEMDGIADGCNANGCKTSIDEIIAWNFYCSIPYWYSTKSQSRVGKEGGSSDRCSAFIAVGDWTADGKIVCAHNSFTDFIDGQFSNVVLDLNPDKGHRFIMQTSPCWIWSGTDFFITATGIIGTETTIGGFIP